MKENKKNQHQNNHKHSFLGKLRTYLLAGILVTAPIGLTTILVVFIINKVDSLVTPLIPSAYNPETYLPFSIPGIGLIIVIIGLILIGSMAAGFFGRLLIRVSESILNKMPVVRGIYSAIKQIFETVISQSSEAFRQVVIFEYPRKGLWAMGFITGKTKGEVQRMTGQEVINVFLPTTPNPTSGFLLFVPKKDLTILDMTVDEGIKMIVSGGIVTPPDPKAKKSPSQSKKKITKK